MSMSENRWYRPLERGTVPVMITHSYTPQNRTSPPAEPTHAKKIRSAIPNSGAPLSAAATRFTYLESPVGELLVTADAAGTLTRLLFPGHSRPPRADWTREESPFTALRAQLDAYFAGELEAFDLELTPSGTPFQLQVWNALRAIPYGATASYGEIARAVGQPGAARAVGGANNRNPISIVIPCHRVIGSSGSLTGYGGGLDRKRQLLALESGARPLL
jgi:methylated-DNA-[protein]-cysteine S-methyltransferase